MDLEELESTAGIDYSGMHCCAGTIVMDIFETGQTRGALCRLAPFVCNIFDENPFERDDWMQPVPCTRERCAELKNWRIAKYRSADEAKDYIAECKAKQKSLLESRRGEVAR